MTPLLLCKYSEYSIVFLMAVQYDLLVLYLNKNSISYLKKQLLYYNYSYLHNHYYNKGFQNLLYYYLLHNILFYHYLIYNF